MSSSSSTITPVMLRLPFSSTSVSVGRRELRDWMVGNGAAEEAVEDARVVISELIANSVRHASPMPDGSILVTWSMGHGGVDVAVTDGGGGTRAHSLQPSTTALAGRGMAIIEALAHEWWTEFTGSRSTVHALLKV